jgi:cytochrome c peroxidase
VALIALQVVACAAPSDPSELKTSEPCDGLTSAECTQVEAWLLPEKLPPSPGNALADNDDAAQFGFQFFFARGFSNGPDVRCVTCHQPELSFRDHGAVSTGVGKGIRNALTIFNAARMSVFFWDGRADSLWSQPLFAIENPVEMNFTRLEIAHRLSADPVLRPLYEKVFGPMPDVSSLPARGAPGDPAWDSLPESDQTTTNRIAANVGKSLEAYMRRNITGRSALDRYLLGDESALSDTAKRGLQVFVKAGCIQCHSGPTLSDQSFHDAHVPALPGGAPDPGRSEGSKIAAQNVFNAAGPFADQKGPAPEPDEAAVGAFRTASLRNVALTPPYGHNGALTTLDEAIHLFDPELVGADFDGLVAFLLSLNGDPSPYPWNNWPEPQ